jgi:hypothetical protein
MCGISTIQNIVQVPLHSGSLHDSPFPAPVFYLLYLLPLRSTPNPYSSSNTTSSVLCILNPSLPSSFIPSSLFLDYPFVIPWFPYVRKAPWKSVSIVIINLSHNNIFIHVPDDFMNIPCIPLKKSLSTTLYELVKSTENYIIYPPNILSNQKSTM